MASGSDPVSAQAARFSPHDKLAFAAVGGATLLAFLPSLDCGFVDWDDPQNFLDNLHYRGLGWENLRWMFSTFLLGPYQPLSWVSYGLDFTFWGMEPRGYHLTNIILHAINAGLFAGVAARLFLIRRTNGAAASQAVLFGVVAGLFWGLHPLRVEAVTWITERREVLCGLFSLLTLGSHLAGRRWFVTAAAALAAMLSKGTAVTLPVLLVLIDLYREGVLDRRGLLRTAAASLRRHAVIVAMAPIFAIIAVIGQREARSVVAGGMLNEADRVAIFGRGMVFYAIKTVWPSRLAPLYEAPPDLSGVRMEGCIAWGLLLLLGLVLWRFRPAMLWILAAYLALVAPVGGLVQVGAQIAADRYAYQPGWILSLVMVGAVWWVIRAVWRGGPRPVVGLALAAAIIGALAPATIGQQRIWRDTLTLWEHQVAVYPRTATARYALGQFYSTRSSEPDAMKVAEEHYRRAVEILPGYAEAYRGLGYVLRRTGRLGEAISTLRLAVACDPHDARAVYGLANALWDAREKADALTQFRKVVELNPELGDSHVVLARVLAASGDAAGALASYARAEQLDPDSPVASLETAHLLATHPDAAIRNAELAMRHVQRATDRYEKIRTRGGDRLLRGFAPRLARTLAAVQAESSRFDDAIRVLETARSADPSLAVEPFIALYRSGQPLREAPHYP